MDTTFFDKQGVIYRESNNICNTILDKLCTNHHKWREVTGLGPHLEVESEYDECWSRDAERRERG